MKLRVSELKGLVGDRLGSGSFARVYELPDFRLPDVDGPVVLKKYRREILPVSAAALDGLCAIRDALPAKQAKNFDRFTTWPLRVVVNDKNRARAVGVVMRRIPDMFFYERKGLLETEWQPRELQVAIQEDDFVQRVGAKPLTRERRLRLVERMSYALARLHKLDVVYGDISMKNVIYDDATGEIMLVDCDSAVRAGTGPPFKRQPHTDGFIPPEAAKCQRP